MRPTLTLLAVALMSGVGACGGLSGRVGRSSKVSASSVASSSASGATDGGGRAAGDYDGDDGRPTDNDSLSLRSYGHAARPPDDLVIGALVKRYYTAAATDNGAKACTLISSGLAKAAPLEYGRNGPAYLHGGKTCEAVLTLLFKHDHRRLAAEVARIELTGVRLEGDTGFVLLRFGTRAPERQVMVGREGGSWKMMVLLDDGMRPVP